MIETALVHNETLRKIAESCSVSITALHRHKEAHLPALLTKATEAAEVAQADDLLGMIRSLHVRALAILEKAEAADQPLVALKAVREIRGILELLCKLDGQLKEPGKVEITVNYVDRAIIAPGRNSGQLVQSSSNADQAGPSSSGGRRLLPAPECSFEDTFSATPVQDAVQDTH